MWWDELSIRTILWKELLDLGRDRRTLLSIALLPMIMLPLLGALTVVLSSKQPLGIAIVNEDAENNESRLFIKGLKAWLQAYAKAYKQVCEVKEYQNRSEALSSPLVDVVIVVPRGFVENLTSLDRPATLLISKRVESAKVQTAMSIVTSAVKGISREYSEHRIKLLLKIAKVRTSPETILSPIKVVVEAHKGPGLKAPPEEEYKFYTTRLLSFALFFVVTPTVTYVSDAIMGEKERKTIEALLSAPIRHSLLLGGKLVASCIIGLIASIADVIGVLTYFYLISTYLGSSTMVFDMKLLAVHAIDMAVTVLVTGAMVTPVVVRAGSVRAANVIASMVVGMALTVFFAVLFVDVEKLPKLYLYPIMLVPYTHSVLVITSFIAGNSLKAALHMLVLIGFSGLLYLVAFKSFNPEKLIMPPAGGERT